MGTSIERHAGNPLAMLEKPLTRITPALRFARQLSDRDPSHATHSVFGRSANMVPWVTEQRSRHLGEFVRADAAEQILCRAIHEPLKRAVAGSMVGAMLSAFGARPDAMVLAGMIDMLNGDDVAIASSLWQPLRASPATVALACRKLIATATFPPRPAELHAACQEANYSLGVAMRAAEELVDFLRRCDALLLEFAHDEWERPYLTPKFQPVLQPMLGLHDIYGDGSDAFDEETPNAFREALERAKAKFALAPPEQAEPPRLAACKTTPAKRTRKPRRPRT